MDNPQTSYILVPNLSTPAGSCLTLDNWAKTGVKAIAFFMDELLIKPGLPLLQRLNSIREYVVWKGEIIFNAMHLTPGETGFKVRSPYDGSVLTLDYSAFIALINQLKPSKLILPASLSLDISKLQTEVFIIKKIKETSSLAYNNEQQAYVIGAKDNLEAAPYMLETDKPAQDGLSGIAYSEEGPLEIHNFMFNQDYSLLSQQCTCQTCVLGLTRAYLHHLFQQTPLLAHRFLIQHNVSFICEKLV
jgi:queuine tRNA-ribosyltransferase